MTLLNASGETNTYIPIHIHTKSYNKIIITSYLNYIYALLTAHFWFSTNQRTTHIISRYLILRYGVSSRINQWLICVCVCLYFDILMLFNVLISLLMSPELRVVQNSDVLHISQLINTFHYYRMWSCDIYCSKPWCKRTHPYIQKVPYLHIDILECVFNVGNQ